MRAGGTLHWDVLRLWHEMRGALSRAPEIEGIGVDTWGVDFALLDEAGALIQNPVHYRDARTDGIPERVFRILSPDQIYETTGVQFMPINTLFQVFALGQQNPRLLGAAHSLVTIPDLLNYWLTGRITCEFTTLRPRKCSIRVRATGPARCWKNSVCRPIFCSQSRSQVQQSDPCGPSLATPQ